MSSSSSRQGSRALSSRPADGSISVTRVRPRMSKLLSVPVASYSFGILDDRSLAGKIEVVLDLEHRTWLRCGVK